MDFMQVQAVLADGRRCRTRTVLDSVTREGLASAVETALPGQQVNGWYACSGSCSIGQLLHRAAAPVASYAQTPHPRERENGPECTGQARAVWA